MNILRELLRPTKQKILWTILSGLLSLMFIPASAFLLVRGGVVALITYGVTWVVGAGFIFGFATGHPFICQFIYMYCVVSVILFLKARFYKHEKHVSSTVR